MFKRTSGILLPISSLPGPFGIGCFGSEARAFAEKAAAAGFSYWQILPLPPTSAGDSPYQGLSAYAGNPYLIDLQQLHDQNLLTDDELASAHYHGDPAKVDYGWLYHTREKLLWKAFKRLNDDQRWYIGEFSCANDAWLNDYVLFRAIKRHHGDAPWWQWPAALRRHEWDALQAFAAENSEVLAYHRFVQYEFDRQWQALKADINDLGIGIIGDMPIYVAHDSADVWANNGIFEMDADSNLLRVAGVPPDYFSADGQLWGNPLYNWDKMAQDGYAWWIDRIRFALKQNDVVRIDHFRGFESYWAVPADAKTARIGVWEKGPAMKLFDVVLNTFPDAPIIAEDLGDIDDDVRAFLDATGLPGMKVMQFGFDGYFDGADLPHQHIANCVAYSGTHDNTTTVGWWHSATPEQVKQVNRFVRFTNDPAYAQIGSENDEQEGAPRVFSAAADKAFMRCFLETLWLSPARLAIAPVQDFLALDESARINSPGKGEGNWNFRLTPDQMDSLDIDWIRNLNQTYFRFNAGPEKLEET